MRGTGYAAVEIIWWLIVATALGVAMGWTLREWALNRKSPDQPIPPATTPTTPGTESD